jgi:hypothetical protein
MKTRFVIVALMSLALALPAFGRTTKSTYPDPCSEVWSAVKDTLSNVDNYSVDASDDTALSASYHPKHTVHVTVTGAVLQRTNHVTLYRTVQRVRCESYRTIADLSTTTGMTSRSAWMNLSQS